MSKALLFLLFPVILCLSCGNLGRQERTYDFPQIVESDTLRILTLNTSTSYFIYRDQPMGYHYDMIRDFCKYHGLVPEIIVAGNTGAMLQMLQNKEADLIAYSMPVTNALKDSVLYCGLQQISHQVLVQRAGQGDTLLTDVTGLIGKRVTVIDKSKYLDRINNLNDELGGGVLIDRVDSDTIVVEDLIRMVSRGEIAYTVADDDLAMLNHTYFGNLNVDLPVSFDQRSSWVVRKDTPLLADSLDSWMKSRSSGTAFLRIIKRYFEETKGYSVFLRPSFREISGHGVISPFDSYFKRYGKESGIDWRLLASVSYQESRFETEGQSWAGATGLMGLMPATAASLGAEGEQLFDPEKNISAGTEYLKNLLHIFRFINNPDERIKMALAAYNGGLGHVFDALALTEKYGGDKEVWEGNVERYLQLKRLEQYYSDPVCKNGYFRADETINYVRDVIDRWQIYKEKLKE
ncbi:MAG: transglycosylase SLT domain-containing protein [Proteiniphilum sp.]|uniref:transglycosylase SLT domain-containing protein n=1 Tax=Proteiniphilum sp. TaxID=1926877 RepID=UPI002ABC5AFC|nr:transglycosylase SLT domain-containing protein [Proteiniphilum sp.]MDY9920146.1 transglycosylase SLT domain-containing protein [Proteiniphilum sp.]